MFTAIPFPVIDPVALAIGPVEIRWYALAYLVGFLGGWRYALHLARRRGDRRPDARDLDDFLTWAVLGVILGGRFGYVVFYNAGYYLDHPLEALYIWQGGMSFHGGLAGMIAAIVAFSIRRGFSPFALGDVIATVVPIGLFFGRLANFINGELFGRTSDVPWAMVFPLGGPEARHPSQLYQAFLEGLVLFIVLALAARREPIVARPGMLSGLFLIGYGVSRYLVEFVREPDPQLGLLLGGIATMGQLLSLPMIAAGIWFVTSSERRRLSP